MVAAVPFPFHCLPSFRCVWSIIIVIFYLSVFYVPIVYYIVFLVLPSCFCFEVICMNAHTQRKRKKRKAKSHIQIFWHSTLKNCSIFVLFLLKCWFESSWRSTTALIDTSLCASNVQHIICNVCKFSIRMNSLIYSFHLSRLCRFTVQKIQLVSAMISFWISLIALRHDSHLNGKFSIGNWCIGGEFT